MAGSDEDRGFSFDLGPTPAPAPARRRLGTEREPELDHLDLDLGDLGLSALATSPPPPAARLPAEASSADAPTSSVAATPVWEGSAPRDPAIKLVRFPVSTPAQATGPAAPLAPRPAPSRPISARTQFSDSISNARPSSEFNDELEPPEDLPDTWAAEHPGSPAALEDTPGLSALWTLARSSFAKRGVEAVTWSRQSANAGRRVAAQFRSALREKSRAAATARLAAASADVASQAASQPRPSSGPATATQTEAASPPRAGAFSLPGRAIHWRPIARRAAAPLATLGLASAVYLGGTQLLGAVSLPSLSHESAPDLGAITEPATAPAGAAPDSTDPGDLAAPRSAASPDKRKRPTSAPRGPAPPQIEQLPLPTGVDFPGKGLIEVVTAEDELIYVNGVFLGRGPLRRVPVTPGEHAVSIRNGNEARAGTLAVEVGRCARVSFVATP